MRDKIKESLKINLKNKDEVAISTVRLILAAIKDHDIQNRTKKNSSEITDEEILNLLQKMIKQRHESVNIYNKAGRLDLKKREEKEIEVINAFLPKQITKEELEIIVRDTAKELDCKSIKDLGKLISFLKEKYPGQLDMKEVAIIAKKILG
tara:strand:- start:58 stop:510 length:453 start_codon:yes stop_codon:yes gene_type:complete